MTCPSKGEKTMPEELTMIGVKQNTKKRFLVCRNIYQGKIPHENITLEAFLIFLLDKFEEDQKHANNSR